jgi:hypothetical protein
MTHLLPQEAEALKSDSVENFDLPGAIISMRAITEKGSLKANSIACGMLPNSH